MDSKTLPQAWSAQHCRHVHLPENPMPSSTSSVSTDGADGGDGVERMERMVGMERFFLHGSRRYVCRGCTSHLRLVMREIRTKRQNETGTNHNKTTKPTPPEPKAGFVPRVGCVSQQKKVKQGEAMNSAFALSTSSPSPHLFSTRRGCLTYALFLHGSRRYVCRGCTSHLKLVKRELRTMRPITTDQGKHKQETKNTNPQTKTPKTKARLFQECTKVVHLQGANRHSTSFCH